ncbi:MAG TPA: hypothetical protein PLB48_13060, partial [Treponema sp.]|nr:hypothetical protein [Treponema sp.]
DTSDEISSFQTNVKVYKENNRSPLGRKLAEEYKLSLKLIDGKLYTRMDYPADEDGSARSVLHTPEELVIFESSSNKVLYRTSVEKGSDDSVAVRTLFSRLPLKDIQNHFTRLSYRVLEDPQNKLLKIETPSAYLADGLIGTSRLASETIYFDTEMEVQVGSDYVMIDQDGTTISVEETTSYQEVDGVPIKTGEVIVRKYDFPYTIDTSDRQIPILNSVDEAEPISEAELAALEEGGALILKEDPILGDPANPDYTETVTIQYENVMLNSVSDSYFRIEL